MRICIIIKIIINIYFNAVFIYVHEYNINRLWRIKTIIILIPGTNILFGEETIFV